MSDDPGSRGDMSDRYDAVSAELAAVFTAALSDEPDSAVTPESVLTAARGNASVPSAVPSIASSTGPSAGPSTGGSAGPSGRQPTRRVGGRRAQRGRTGRSAGGRAPGAYWKWGGGLVAAAAVVGAAVLIAPLPGGDGDTAAHRLESNGAAAGTMAAQEAAPGAESAPGSVSGRSQALAPPAAAAGGSRAAQSDGEAHVAQAAPEASPEAGPGAPPSAALPENPPGAGAAGTAGSQACSTWHTLPPLTDAEQAALASVLGDQPAAEPTAGDAAGSCIRSAERGTHITVGTDELVVIVGDHGQDVTHLAPDTVLVHRGDSFAQVFANPMPQQRWSRETLTAIADAVLAATP